MVNKDKDKAAIILQKRKFYKQFLRVIYNFFWENFYFCENNILQIFRKYNFCKRKVTVVATTGRYSFYRETEIFLLCKNVFHIPFLVFFLLEIFNSLIELFCGMFQWHLELLVDYILKRQPYNKEPFEKVTPSYVFQGTRFS